MPRAHDKRRAFPEAEVSWFVGADPRNYATKAEWSALMRTAVANCVEVTPHSKDPDFPPINLDNSSGSGRKVCEGGHDDFHAVTRALATAALRRERADTAANTTPCQCWRARRDGLVTSPRAGSWPGGTKMIRRLRFVILRGRSNACQALALAPHTSSAARGVVDVAERRCRLHQSGTRITGK
jgi:hypothetical protein